MERTLTVKEAAERRGKGPQFVRLGLQKKSFPSEQPSRQVRNGLTTFPLRNSLNTRENG